MATGHDDGDIVVEAIPDHLGKLHRLLEPGMILGERTTFTSASSEGMAQYSNFTGLPDPVATSKAKPAVSRWHIGSSISTGCFRSRRTCGCP